MLIHTLDIDDGCALSTNIIVRHIVAVFAAWTAETVTYPLDLIKTRLHVQNEIATFKYGYKMEYHGMFGTAIQIAKNEGFFKLWSGLMVMWQRHIIYTGYRLVFYEYLRNIFKSDTGKISLPEAVFCGMTAGGVAQLIASPTDLVKVQMQTEGRRVLQGMQPRITSSISVYKLIYNEGGILGFWRGAVPNVQRAALVAVGNLSTYDYSKQFLKTNADMPESLGLHVCSAIISGFVATVMGSPCDVIKTRIMNQAVRPGGKGCFYEGTKDCFRQTVTNEGFFALYKGFLPVWIRSGPWALVSWLVFENAMSVLSEISI